MDPGTQAVPVTTGTAETSNRWETNDTPPFTCTRLHCVYDSSKRTNTDGDENRKYRRASRPHVSGTVVYGGA